MAANPAEGSSKPVVRGTPPPTIPTLPHWAAVLLHYWAGTDRAIRTALTFLVALSLAFLLATIFPAPVQESTTVLLLPFWALLSYYSARLCRRYRRARRLQLQAHHG